MPTARPRHSLTESDELAEALEDAAERWPQDAGRPSRLLLRLIEEGHRAVRSEREQGERAQLEAVRRTSGALTGVYPEDYLAHLRDEWPE